MGMIRHLWSISSLSIELGIDRRTLSKKLSDLRPDGEAIEAGKTVRRWHLMHVLKHLEAADRATAAEGQNVLAGRARLVKARARREELQVAALERRLLPFDGVVAAWEMLIAAFRARALAIPTRTAQQLAATSERSVVQALLTAEIRTALEELSQYDPGPMPGSPPRGEPHLRGSNGKSRPRRAPVH